MSREIGRSLGGKIRAEQQRMEALNKYYQNPNKCLHCNKTIEVIGKQKVSEVKKKKFCDKICAGSHNNRNRIRIKKIKPMNQRKIKNNISVITKEELFGKRKH